MRAIDADELIKFYVNALEIISYSHSIKNPNQVISNIENTIKIIEDAKTIDPTPVSSWNYELLKDKNIKYTCDNCGFEKKRSIKKKLEWKFCPMCGAKIKNNNIFYI